MNGRTRFSGGVLAIGVVMFALLAGPVVFSGCEKETPTAQEQMQQMPVHEHAAADQPQVAATVEQTTCPVMGGPVNKAIFVEYQGKKVYFCCKGCPETFKADPKKYIAKLPQFQE